MPENDVEDPERDIMKENGGIKRAKNATPQWRNINTSMQM